MGIVGETKPEAAVSSFRAPTAVSVATTCGMTTRTFVIFAAVKDASHFTGKMVVWSQSTMFINVTITIKAKALTKGSPGLTL